MTAQHDSLVSQIELYIFVESAIRAVNKAAVQENRSRLVRSAMGSNSLPIYTYWIICINP